MPRPREKKDIKIGCIPITCATPIIMAHLMGFYSKHGLHAQVVRTAEWAARGQKEPDKRRRKLR
ncbi:MAG TPA: ABC transporter substrate-binding protein [Alphaproteobacteria bacterium]|nr:ABC transporter substrate-binding protein [Alphaproteobacteria bacterium]